MDSCMYTTGNYWHQNSLNRPTLDFKRRWQVCSMMGYARAVLYRIVDWVKFFIPSAPCRLYETPMGCLWLLILKPKIRGNIYEIFIHMKGFSNEAVLRGITDQLLKYFRTLAYPIRTYNSAVTLPNVFVSL